MVEQMKSKGVEVKLSCKILGISRSGYYAWQERPMSLRFQHNQRLVEKIQNIHQESRNTYGVPRVVAQLKKEGEMCGKNRVAKLMKQANLSGVAQKLFKIKTTDSKHDLPIADRIFQAENQETFPEKPNEVWASDITYIPTEEGWLFLVIFLDVFTRKVVGYAMAEHMRTELVLKALMMAVLKQNPEGNQLVSHSDRGSQYAAEDLRKRLNLLGIQASMSRKGNCYDNAFAESFFHSLKVELIHHRTFKTRKEATIAIFEYIEIFYNRKRLHSSLGYKTPVEYEEMNSAA